MRLCLVAIFSFLSFFASAQEGGMPADIYSFKLPALKGGVIDMAQYRGKKILIVNTPEERDFATQYTQLEALSQKYKNSLVIIGVLADDFQIEPGSKKTPNIEKHYNVTFPLATKMFVRGSKIAPFYKWLSEKRYNKFQDTEVSWDFIKFLFNENGALVAVYDPYIEPTGQEISGAIEK